MADAFLVAVLIGTIGIVLFRLYGLRCPHCSRRAMRILGVETCWTADWREHRFHASERRCCGKPAYRRMDLFAVWKPEKEV
jgi:hypothetical protein